MKILVEKAVIEQALEALEQWKEHDAWHKRNDWNDEDESAITALREALAEPDIEKMTLTQIAARHKQAKQEPVAWLYRGELHWENPSEWAKGEVTPLYTDAPQSNTQQEPIARVPLHPEQGLEWFKPSPVWGTLLYAAPVRTKDLTDDEIGEIDDANWDEGHKVWDVKNFARAAIAADRRKNR